jgi:hypothetical protein
LIHACSTTYLNESSLRHLALNLVGIARFYIFSCCSISRRIGRWSDFIQSRCVRDASGCIAIHEELAIALSRRSRMRHVSTWTDHRWIPDLPSHGL